MFVPFVSLVVTAVFCLTFALLQAAGQPLPVLKLDSFPAAARDAIARVQKEAVAHPKDVERVGAFAQTLHAWEQWDAAHQAYAHLQQLEPKSFGWHYLDAVVLQRLARHGEAAEHLRKALSISPDYVPARVKLAEALFDSGNIVQSRPLFEALVREPAAEPVAELGLGRIAAAEGRHDAAVSHFERAVSLFPEFGAAHYALARSYRALGRIDEARAALGRHEEYGARWPAIEDQVLARVTALKDDARAHVQRGVKLADRGELEAAIAAHQAALAIEPLLPDAHSNLISLYGRVREWAKAEEHYRTVLRLGVNLADAHYDYGVLLGMQERWDEAADAYRKAIAVNPAHADARNNLGQILEGRRQLEEAAAEYRKAVEDQPTFRIARFNLGRMLIALGRTEEAVRELAYLTEPRDAESARYLFALSVAHVRAGRKDEGIKWAAEARAVAQQFGQRDLVAAIDRELARLK